MRRSRPSSSTGVAQRDRVRACDADQRALDVSNPWDDRAVVEAQRELHTHRHGAANALDDTDNGGIGVSRRHEVDEPNRTVRCLERGLEHEGVALVAASGRVEVAFGLDRPVPVLGIAEESREDRTRVEPGDAQPVDFAVTAHQRCRLQVPDEPVILDERHQSSSRKVAYGRKRFDAARLNVRRYSFAMRSSSDEAYVSRTS